MTDARLRRVFNVELNGKICICRVLNDSHRYYELHEEGNVLLRLVQENHPRHMIVDLGEVEMLNSNLVGVLVRVFRAVEPQGGRMVICRVRPQAKQVLNSMRLAKLWDFAETVPAALGHLQGSDSGTTMHEVGE